MKYRNVALAAFFVVLLDQLTKFFLTNKHYSIAGFPIINYTENTGAAFSILEGQRWLFIAASVTALVILIYFITKVKDQHKSIQLCTGMLIGGIVGNLIDRVFLGYVRDFVYSRIWPTFNVADSSMLIAVLLFVIFFLRKKQL